jgi:hypothetical protein
VITSPAHSINDNAKGGASYPHTAVSTEHVPQVFVLVLTDVFQQNFRLTCELYCWMLLTTTGREGMLDYLRPLSNNARLDRWSNNIVHKGKA